MSDAEFRLECLKLAAQFMPEKEYTGIADLATEFYKYVMQTHKAEIQKIRDSIPIKYLKSVGQDVVVTRNMS